MMKEETERMKKMRKVMNEMKVPLTMTAVTVSFAAAAILYKIVTEDGMSFVVLNAYRFMFATAFMIPLSLFTDRKPKLSRKVFFMTFMCGLFGGTIFQGLQMESLVLTSATFVSASLNLIPAITFLMALPFRLERLNLGEAAGWAKIAGTIAGIGGAMIMTFVKGPRVHIFHSHMDLRHHHHAHLALHNDTARQALGVVCAIGSCFSYAFWLIIQGVMSKTPSEYPSHLTNTALMSTMAAIQSTAFGLCVERDWRQWKLGWDLRLFTVAFAGIVASGVMVIAIAWCVEMKGPLFVSSYTPIMLFLVLIAASYVLDEKLFLGSVIGAVLIVLGLYLVVWGKVKEVNKMKAPHQHSNHHITTTKNQQQQRDLEAI